MLHDIYFHIHKKKEEETKCEYMREDEKVRSKLRKKWDEKALEVWRQNSQYVSRLLKT